MQDSNNKRNAMSRLGVWAGAWNSLYDKLNFSVNLKLLKKSLFFKKCSIEMEGRRPDIAF